MEHNYIFDVKISEKHLDDFVNDIYTNIKSDISDSYYFDLTKTLWISNQELLVFTSILFYFVEKKINFSIDFFKKGTFPSENKRKAYLLINLWDNWKIYQIIPDYKYQEYLGITARTISELKKVHDIKLIRNEIYKSNQINTPFQYLDFLENYKDSELDYYIQKFVKLEKANIEIIKKEKLQHPFLNRSLGSIIIKELYENFLDHFSNPFFDTEKNYSFLSLSIHGQIDASKNDEKSIEAILSQNFQEENLIQTKSFFYVQKTVKVNHRQRVFLNHLKNRF